MEHEVQLGGLRPGDVRIITRSMMMRTFAGLAVFMVDNSRVLLVSDWMYYCYSRCVKQGRRRAGEGEGANNEE